MGMSTRFEMPQFTPFSACLVSITLLKLILDVLIPVETPRNFI